MMFFPQGGDLRNGVARGEVHHDAVGLFCADFPEQDRPGRLPGRYEASAGQQVVAPKQDIHWTVSEKGQAKLGREAYGTTKAGRVGRQVRYAVYIAIPLCPKAHGAAARRQYACCRRSGSKPPMAVQAENQCRRTESALGLGDAGTRPR